MIPAGDKDKNIYLLIYLIYVYFNEFLNNILQSLNISVCDKKVFLFFYMKVFNVP